MNHHHHHAINDAFPSPPSPSPTPEDHSNHSFSLWGLLFGSHELCKLLKIEINLLVTVILVILIFYLGLKRRSSRSPGLSRVLFLAYVGFSTTISYTMGMIYDSTLNHALFAMWAGLVLNAYLSIDTIVAYSLMDHEKRRRYFLELFLLGCFFWWIMFNHNRPLYLSLPTFALWMLMWMKASERLQAFEMACRSGLAQFAKPTADFMEKMSKQSMNREVGYFANPSTMSGYKYLLEDPDECDNEEKNTMTLERLWQFEGGILSSIDGIHFAKLKDTCLSFALFKLLLRRFAGYTMHEANQKKTWRFVRYGLVDHQGYARPFQVIGDELHYVHDFFYTKNCVLGMYDNMLLSKMIYMMLYLGCGIYVAIELARHPLSKLGSEKITFKGKYVLDVGVTRIALTMIAVLEIVQFAMLMLSNWTIVRWLVNYVKSPQSLNEFRKIVLLKLLPLAHKWNFKYKPWARKLGQYSFLENYTHLPLLLRIQKITSIGVIRLSKIMTLPRIGQLQDSDINLSEEVKRAVLESLKAYNDVHGPPKLTNGVTSLTRNGVANRLSWACQSGTQAQVVMVWHIATTVICQRRTPSNGVLKNVHNDFHVATSLSKYCAYLVAFAPELLPGHQYTTECIFDNLVSKAKCFFGKKNVTMESKIQKLLAVKEEDPIGCSLKKGGLLAQTLLNEVKTQARLWKVLAEFWAEMILFLAPSNNVTAHVERLANGGEFITHLWALLTHAGILTTESG